jgi:hypothetical protein
MDPQRREPWLLLILAVLGGMLAWARGAPLFLGFFTAEAMWASFVVALLSLPPD